MKSNFCEYLYTKNEFLLNQIAYNNFFFFWTTLKGITEKTNEISFDRITTKTFPSFSNKLLTSNEEQKLRTLDFCHSKLHTTYEIELKSIRDVVMGCTRQSFLWWK